MHNESFNPFNNPSPESNPKENDEVLPTPEIDQPNYDRIGSYTPDQHREFREAIAHILKQKELEN